VISHDDTSRERDRFGMMSEQIFSQLEDRPGWWGDYSFPVDSSLSWQIGPLLLSVWRRAQEWQVSSARAEINEQAEDIWRVEPAEFSDPDQGELNRHIFTQTEESISLVPMLADRSVVVKSVKPFQIHPGQRVNIFVSTPLWVGLRVQAQNIVVQQLPLVRPSDTWFGPSTMEGELCYASTTQGRFALNDLPQRVHRATTPVLIDNQSSKAILLQRLCLPVPYLSLHDTKEHGLWTEAITMTSNDDTDFAHITVAEAPPAPYRDAQKISEPRELTEKNVLVRTFDALFG